MSDDMLYRRKSIQKPRVVEDADYYGYTDNNGGPVLDTDITPPEMGEISPTGVYRKHKKNSKVRIVRKPVKRCKCKKT